MARESIRPATAADLPAIGAIWYEAEREDDPTVPRLLGVPSLYAHELATRELYVAERDGSVVGFGAVVERGGIAFLADLFVRAAHRSTGVGKRLLEHMLPRDERTRCTIASGDSRAISLYTRFGMRPRLPILQLVGSPDGSDLPSTDVELVPADIGDPELVRWDADIAGRLRPEDHAYWVHARRGVPFWFGRGGTIVGYGLAQLNSDDLLHHPDAATLGPIGVRSPADAAACVLAAVRWARRQAPTARVSLLGPHPALPVLLEAGFRVTSLTTFCSSADEPFADPYRYVPSGPDLF